MLLSQTSRGEREELLARQVLVPSDCIFDVSATCALAVMQCAVLRIYALGSQHLPNRDLGHAALTAVRRVSPATLRRRSLWADSRVRRSVVLNPTWLDGNPRDQSFGRWRARPRLSNVLPLSAFSALLCTARPLHAYRWKSSSIVVPSLSRQPHPSKCGQNQRQKLSEFDE